MDVSGRYRELLDMEPSSPLLQYDGFWTTVGDVRHMVTSLDAILREAGLAEGAKLGLVTRNRSPQVAVLVTSIATRRCLVPITSIQSDTGMAADVEKLGVPVLIADDEDWRRDGLIDACRKLGVLGVVVSSDRSSAVRLIAELATRHVDAEVLPDVAVLMPTSGTTGPPKRITYRFEQLNAALDRIANYSAANARTLRGPLERRKGVVIASLAMAHVAGFWAVFQALASGRAVALLDRFSPEEWADLVEEHGARLAALPPTTMRMVLDADIPRQKLATLLAVMCGTAPLDPEMADAFTTKYDVPVLTAYGATEFPGGLVGWSLDDYKRYWASKRGAAGRPRPGMRLRIVDGETGRVLAPGSEGLVSVWAPQSPANEDGWVRTNDIGRIDEDDFVWIVGRADDAINRGGFKIVPQVVEGVLRSHPAVIEAGVVGTPDRRLGQVPVAAVTVSEPVTGDELIAWARQQMPTYQVPTTILVVAELPRTSSLKVSKEGIRALFDVST
jgi:acyl-coenzyme A synthetase/AMP-(fatty) acid ligase